MIKDKKNKSMSLQTYKWRNAVENFDYACFTTDENSKIKEKLTALATELGHAKVMNQDCDKTG